MNLQTYSTLKLEHGVLLNLVERDLLNNSDLYRKYWNPIDPNLLHSEQSL